ncbi:MAG: CcmD family protein [Candidatus Thermoplasmatota archaeon]|nr:CcmD family protein [Candidatus Thermoplasmatota archaeon]MBU1914354.1 CcmD family protein [Candidatus Thermoplasmatota archaeon]
MSNSFTAVYIAYSIVWVGVFAYLVYMHIRQRTVERDIRTLKEEVRKHGQ